MKRAIPPSKQDAGNGKKAKMSSQQQTSQPRRFVFKDLPDGVRNQIYDLVASGATTSLSKTGDKLTSNSGLMLANRRISREFATMLDGSPEINVAIDHFKFTNLIKFLKTRSSVSSGRITKAVLKIRLKVDICPGNCDAQDPDLIQWALFLGRQEFNGTKISAEYSAVGDYEAMGEWITALDTCTLSHCSSVCGHHFTDMIKALQDADCD